MKKIVFYPQSKLAKELVAPPQKVTPPEWFKKIPLYVNGKHLHLKYGEPNYSAKGCMPFLDTLTSGYTFNLNCDILVEKDKLNDGYNITWNNNVVFAPVVSRVTDKGTLPQMSGFTGLDFSWVSYWGIKTPKGYSSLLTHPFNRTDLPFFTTTGIMDTDKWGIWGRQPFALQEGFEGVIEAGTPIIHLFPFKRENWTSKISTDLTEWANYEEGRRANHFRGYYKNKYWSKKNYE